MLSDAKDLLRFAVLGNSGSGKSTLAGWLARSAGLELLDLDCVAWDPQRPGVQRPHEDAVRDVTGFCSANPNWVLEGCCGNLVEFALQYRPLLVFLNPGVERCTENCLQRPWEPHKYASKQAQDANLQFLLSWVEDYFTRDGDMSLQFHRKVFDHYAGPKVELRDVPCLNPPDAQVLSWLRL